MSREKTGRAPAPERAKQPAQDELRVAYEIHTLAHLIYGQLATTNPWWTQAPEGFGGPPWSTWNPSLVTDPVAYSTPTHWPCQAG